jgi:hypothetical protein
MYFQSFGRSRPLRLASVLTLILAASAACTAASPPEATSAEAALMVDHVKNIQPLELDKPFDGRLDRKVRVYGLSFEAKAGATIHVDLSTRAGKGAQDVQPGAPLDTVAALYGPMKGDSKGPRLSLVEDGSPLPALDVKEDGTYLLAFGTWDDPGTDGTFTVKAGCEGTDFQCLRPVGQTCTNNVRYIQGGTHIGTETWNDCTVVLLEEAHVDAGAVLTISPGVTVKGNFIGTGPYGSIGLVVDGTVQAVGTKEHPIVFTALKDGWAGVTVKGNSSTFQNVFVEKAATGLAVYGSGNSFNDVVIDSGGLGMLFAENSKDNAVKRVRIDQIDSGIRFEQGSAATIDDSTLVGRGNGNGVGIQATGAEVSQFRRALVAGFGDGLRLDGTALDVTDGTITNNARGVTLTGPNAGVHPKYPACPSTDWPAPVPPPAPPTYTYYRRDPSFVRCDITKNKEYGIKLLAPELLVVEDSNIKNNGAGVVIEADGLNADSRIVRSNVYGNGNGLVQVESSHRDGTLNISGNFWNQISDPELSASWKVAHSASSTCRADGCGSQNCGSSYTCSGGRNYHSGQQGNTYYWDGCSAPSSVSWSGALSFTGFSPTELVAGPKEADLCDLVKRERQEQSK